jgi:hypothetical protein
MKRRAASSHSSSRQKTRKTTNPISAARQFGKVVSNVSNEDILKELSAQFVIRGRHEVSVATFFPNSLIPISSLIELTQALMKDSISFKHVANFISKLHHASFGLLCQHPADHTYLGWGAPCLQHRARCQVPKIDLLLCQCSEIVEGIVWTLAAALIMCSTHDPSCKFPTRLVAR